MKPTPGALLSSRRRALGALGGLLGVTAGARAVENVYLGYGTVEGTNLLAQDLEAYASERFGVRESSLRVGDAELAITPEGIRVRTVNGTQEWTVGSGDIERAARVDATLGLEDGPVEQLAADLDAIARGAISFQFCGLETGFERRGDDQLRPYTVAAIRGPTYDRVDTEIVEELTGIEPYRTDELVAGLATGLRRHSEYDIQRYLAGAVEDNVLQGTVDLRSWFDSPDDLAAIVGGSNDGLFCTEITHATIEAFHAVEPHRQTVPVACAHVADRRHKHAYTGIATVLRRDGELVVQMTFADYMNPLLHETLYARWLLGDGLDAYDDGHRTTNIYWNEYAGIA